MSVQSVEWPKVRDFMGRGVVAVHQDSNVDKAVKAMADNDIGSVVVVDTLGPACVLTERDIVSRVLAKGKDPAATVITEVASQKFPSVDASASLMQAALAMVAKKSRLMVFERDEIVGMLTASDVVRALSSVSEDFPIEAVVSRRLVTALPETPVDVVVKVMDEKRVGSVLVGEESQLNSIFTERDLIRRVLSPRMRTDTGVGKVSTSPLITAGVGATGKAVAETMASRKVKRLPLLLADTIVGMVTARDVVEGFTLSGRSAGSKLDWTKWN